MTACNGRSIIACLPKSAICCVVSYNDVLSSFQDAGSFVRRAVIYHDELVGAPMREERAQGPERCRKPCCGRG